ncbi:glycerol-3-phosphate phosphatase-like [Ptychodera flava]|uniref:glycerol-3-phosphate phosphatase-like n=1 Tax=Ptychodera flava TaxID=63121 RepID=UPI00396A0F01
MAACAEVTKKNITEFVSSFDTVLTDCDGVLWRGEDDLIEGSSETLQKLRAIGKRVIYISNNSTMSRQKYQEKLHRLGFQADLDEIVNVTTVCCRYIKEALKVKGRVYVIGGQGYAAEMENHGIRYFGIGDEPVQGGLREWQEMEYENDVDVVMVAFDPHFNFMKLMKAANYLNNPKCQYLANSLDTEFPLPNNERIVPATGCFVSALRSLVKREPMIIGKPGQLMFDTIKRTFPDVDPDRTVIIGDHLTSDIKFGHNNGIKSLLVLSGISTLDEAKENQKSNSIERQKSVPDYFISSITELGKLLQVYFEKFVGLITVLIVYFG